MRVELQVIEGQNDDSLSLSEHLNLVNAKLEEVGCVQVLAVLTQSVDLI